MYKELVKQLRSTVSRSKRTLFDDAADAIEQLQKELREERYRHDRLQDFEVAEAEQLHQMRIERNMLSKKLRERESVLSLLRQGKQRWISVEHELPPNSDKFCLVVVSGTYRGSTWERAIETAIYSIAESWIVECCPYMENMEVAHWMPLPELPEEG